MKSIKPLSVLGIICVFLVGYQFMGAAVWTSPTASSPNNNTDAPINIGATTQQKAGNLQANIFAAGVQMRSNLYCDEVGYNCFDPAEVVSPSTCPTGEFVTGFRPNGELKCATPSGGSSNCVIEQRTVSACVYDSSSVPPCPSGWNQISLNQGGRCSTNNVTWSRLCIRNVCS